MNLYKMNCEYKNLLGAPNTGVHSYRIFNIAIVDLVLTILAAGMISWFWKFSFLISVFMLIVFGVIVHYVLCVPTALNKSLGLA